MPPGFTHELPQHLQQQEHGVFDEEKGVLVLDFDHFCCGTYTITSLISTYDPDWDVTIGAHGFSALIVSSILSEE